MNDVYTEDFSKFGFRELDEAGKLLTAIKNGLPSDFDDEGIKVGFNMNSGFVFLTNSEYQVAMLDDKGKLYSFYTTPYEGYEGSLEELLEEYDNMNDEDKDFVDELVSRGYWYIINCRICENALEPLLTYKNMPKAAQNFPDKDSAFTSAIFENNFKI